MSISTLAIALTATLLAVIGTPSVRAEKPGPVGFRLVYAHDRNGSKLSADHALCTDGDPAERERYAVRIDGFLSTFDADRARTPAKDLKHPDVVAAIAWADALATCRDNIRSPPPAVESPPEPAPTSGFEPIADTGEGQLQDFKAAVPADLRAALAALAAIDPAEPGTFPDTVAAVAAMHDAATALWPHCTGAFAALVMGGAPPEPPPLDEDPWRLCRAAAGHASTLKVVAEGVLARGVEALAVARAKAEALASGAKAEVDAARAALEAAATEAGEKLDDAALATEAVIAAAIEEVNTEVANLQAVAALAGDEALARVAGAVESARGVVDRHRVAAEDFVKRLGESASEKTRNAIEGALKRVSPSALRGLLGLRKSPKLAR
jgi:hypothetical protein